ncbi:MAG: hypothetical protein M4D80_02400 [Myxococcota bacterium]|nr:hypothetical protein [Myxococcota bacterium]
MKSLVGIVLGGLLAVTIGCAAKSKSAAMAPTTAAEPGAMGGAATPRDEIDRLDQAINDEMGRLSLTRPTPPPLTCSGETCAQQMSGAAVAATAPQPAECRPASTQTCTDSCKLKSSICENAGRICRIASDLGGNDAYANDKCNSGNASCEAAKQRCCSCM